MVRDLPGATETAAEGTISCCLSQSSGGHTMEAVEIGFFVIPFILGILVFSVTRSMDWHWSLCVILAAIPVVASFLFGVYGLLGSAMYVGGLYKASAKR
jgi:hypothetical protein